MVRPVDGRGFAFVPRTLVAQPKAFGLAPGLLEPAHGVDHTGERYRAAMLQHLMAVAVRAELLKTEGLSPSGYVARFEYRGLGTDRVRRIFRGETMAQLTDLVFWISQFPSIANAITEPVTVWFTPTETLTPPAANAGVSMPDEFDVQAGESPASTPRTESEEMRAVRGAAVLGQDLDALRRQVATPVAHRSPQNPYGSPSRRIR